MVAYHVSVRTFVEFLKKSGDIDNRIRASTEASMREGARVHKMIQKSRGPRYRAEVPLSFTYDTGRYTLTVGGRADGIAEAEAFPDADGAGTVMLSGEGEPAQLSFVLADEDKNPAADVSGIPVPVLSAPVTTEASSDPVPLPPRFIVEEIKCTWRNVARMKKPVAVHLAQAMCYAYFLCAGDTGQETGSVGVCVTYYHPDTGQTRMFRDVYTAEALHGWFSGMLNEYLKWSDFRYDWEGIRTASIRGTVFPFEYRAGQKELAAAVYRTIVHGRKLFLEAPTGTGKTIATVFPAVKAVGEGKAKRLFYLTARTITRTAAEEAFRLMRTDSGLRFKTVTLTAKEKICVNDVCDCNPEACPYAKGHLDRVNGAVYDLLTHEDVFDRACVETYAEKHVVCPFELALDMSLFADGVICDYNYLFDPFVYLRRFFADGEDGENLFLIDEAHNLVERGREMYSAVLQESDFVPALKAASARKRLAATYTAAEKTLDALRAFGATPGKNGASYRVLGGIAGFMERVSRLMRHLSEYLDDRTQGRGRAGEETRKVLLTLYLQLFRFRTIYEGIDGRYRIYVENGEETVLRIFCIDPSDDLAACMKKGRSSVLFSATLLPVQYYKRLLGGREEDYEIYAESVFDNTRCARVIIDDVTSKYTARGGNMYRRIAQAIHAVIRARRGNYLVFFPSFAFLNEVLSDYRAFAEQSGERIVVQEQEMGEEEREMFLRAFLPSDLSVLAENPVLAGLNGAVEEDFGTTGFCVLGGIFNEGIDLPGNALIGVCVVGTGLPGIGTERDILREGFDEQGDDGFDYAFRFPGMNRVLQAAGRVIRTREDVGVVALLDARFAETRTRSLFPREWGRVPALSSDAVYDFLIKFWSQWEESC